MIGNLSHIMTLANSIIGVSVLAMPFCFKQCGIVLATLVLLVSSVLSRLACHFLIKSAVMSRRRNFEFLAFHAFGQTGKFLVELFIIGFLVGTCIAFFVVVGDLGPQIVGKMLNKEPEDIRTSLLVTTGTFIVFPLGLLRNIDSLSSVCTATIGFYLCLVVKVIAESARHIFLGDWYDRVVYWRPAGILQCLPIFAMALFCQTQLFEIYEAIPNVSLEKMNQVVRGALNICTVVYLCVGFFGYVAFCTQPFTGNILMSFEPSLTSDLIKMGFVFSVAFSFPLVIFPCRASLNSLLFRRAHTHEPSNYYIPEVRFRCLTLVIVAISLGTGILIPNIEFVLGIVGSTIGVMICLIFPAAFFIAISTKNTNERLIAQAILFFGMWIMVLGTYANVYAMEESSSARLVVTTGKPLHRANDVKTFNSMPREEFPVVRQLPKDVKGVQEQSKGNLEMPQQQQHNGPKEKDEAIDVRREPPIPVERSNLVDASSRPLMEHIDNKEVKNLDTDVKSSSGPAVVAAVEESKSPNAENAVGPVKKNIDETKVQADEQKNENLIDSDAIKKEESELAAAGDLADIEAAARREKLRLTLEKHKLEQLKMMQEQKELLKDIKEQKQELELEKKRRAQEQREKNSETRVETVNKVEKMTEEKSSILRGNPAADSVDRRSAEDQNERRKTAENLPVNEPNVQQSVISPQEFPDLNNLLPETGAKRDNGAVVSSIVESVKSRGPILNALTNWTSKRNASADPLLSINDETQGDLKIAQDPTVDKPVESLPKKNPLEFALPIALQMRNQTKESPERKTKSAGAADPETLAIRRDILERADREKREATNNLTDGIDVTSQIRDALPIETKAKSVDSEKDGAGRDPDQCRQRDDKSTNFISRDEIPPKTREETTTVPSSIITIRTIVYLAEQQFTDKIIPIDPGNVLAGDQSDLPNLKKRDLKALSEV